jgi:tetratricopeptide (TPR) repeat protein
LRECRRSSLLRLCALLAPDAIPEEILTAGASWLEPVLAPVAANVLLLNQAIEGLRAYSLVQRDPKEKSLSVHRLMQAVLQDALSEAERRGWAERAMCAVNAAFPDVEYGTWAQCERLLPQALAAAQGIERHQLFSEEAGWLLYKTASHLLDRARYSEAKPLYQRALRIWEQACGPEHPQVATSLYGLAFLSREQGKYAEAEPLYQRTLSIRTQVLTPEHPDTAQTMHDLALLREVQGNSEEARVWYTRALAIREQGLGAQHPRTRETRTRLIALLHSLGWHEEAAQIEKAQVES